MVASIRPVLPHEPRTPIAPQNALQASRSQERLARAGVPEARFAEESATVMELRHEPPDRRSGPERFAATSPEFTEPGPARYNATVTDLHRIHEDLMILRVRPDGGIPAHVGGQFALIGLGAWEPLAEGCVDRVPGPVPSDKLIKRAYSLSTSFFGSNGELLGPEDEDYLELYVALVREDDPRVASLTGRLFALRRSGRLWVREQILGKYTVEGVEPEDAVLFLATGTGEAPHNAMLLDLLRRGHRGPIASVVCVRRSRDLGYLEQHRRLEARWERYRYVALTTRDPDHPRERIQDLLRSDDLEDRIGFHLDPARTHVFVCGNPGMVGVPRRGSGGRLTYAIEGGVIEMLARRGFAPDTPGCRGSVHYEAFW